MGMTMTQKILAQAAGLTQVQAGQLIEAQLDLVLGNHAAPVVEQFQQMQAALHAEIQSAQPVRIGISVSLVPDYLPGLETQLDKFRQQYPHIEMRFRLLENDAVADGVEQGELDAGMIL